MPKAVESQPIPGATGNRCHRLFGFLVAFPGADVSVHSAGVGLSEVIQNTRTAEHVTTKCIQTSS